MHEILQAIEAILRRGNGAEVRRKGAKARK